MKPKSIHTILTLSCTVVTVAVLYITISKIKISNENILNSKFLQFLVGISGLMINLLALSLYFTVKENKGISIDETKSKEPRAFQNLGSNMKEMALIVKIPSESEKSISTNRNIKKFELDSSQKNLTLTYVNNETATIKVDDCQLIYKAPESVKYVKENLKQDNLVLYLDMNNESVKYFNNFIVSNLIHEPNLSYDTKTNYRLTGNLLTNQKNNPYTLISQKMAAQPNSQSHDFFSYLKNDLYILRVEGILQKIKGKIIGDSYSKQMFALIAKNDTKDTMKELKSLFSKEELETITETSSGKLSEAKQHIIQLIADTAKENNICTLEYNTKIKNDTLNKYTLICQKEYQEQVKKDDLDPYYFLEKDLDILFNLKYKINSENNKLESCESISQKIKDKILSSIENQITFALAISSNLGKSTSKKLESLFSEQESQTFNNYVELFRNHLKELEKLLDNDRTIEKSQELLEKELEDNQGKELIKTTFRNILTKNLDKNNKIPLIPEHYSKAARKQIVTLVAGVAKENGISTINYSYSENSSLNCNINEVVLHKRSPSHKVSNSCTRHINEDKEPQQEH